MKSRQSESDISDSASLHGAVSDSSCAKDVIGIIVHGLSEDDDEVSVHCCCRRMEAFNKLYELSQSFKHMAITSGSDKLCTFSPKGVFEQLPSVCPEASLFASRDCK